MAMLVRIMGAVLYRPAAGHLVTGGGGGGGVYVEDRGRVEGTTVVVKQREDKRLPRPMRRRRLHQ